MDKSQVPVRYGTRITKEQFVDFNVRSEEVYTERRVLVSNKQEELAHFIRFRKDTNNFLSATFRIERKPDKQEYYVIMGWTVTR